MEWARILAYITGNVDQELLVRNEYLATENRILRAQFKGRLLLSDAEKKTLADIGYRHVCPMLGFKRFTSAARFCPAHDELRNYLHSVTARNQMVSLTRRRLMHTRHLCFFRKLLKAA